MTTTDNLVADWIGIRKTIKRQLDHLNDGHKMLAPGMDTAKATAVTRQAAAPDANQPSNTSRARLILAAR